jgi:hypothetical protein
VRSGPTGLVHPGLDTFAEHLALEFCDYPRNLKSQPTRWQSGIEALFQRNDVYPQHSAFLNDMVSSCRSHRASRSGLTG